MITKDDWLPVGTVVTLEGGSRPVMIAGVMALDGRSGCYWDYIGVPYPEGRTAPDEGYFFDKRMIDRLHQLGYLDDKGTAFQMFLEANTAPFERMRSERAAESGEE